MDKVLSLSHAQRANLNYLLLLRDAALLDLSGAICSFGVGKRQIAGIANLAPDEILEFVYGLGDQALFVPRSDLLTLFSVPKSVASAVAASRSSCE